MARARKPKALRSGAELVGPVEVRYIIGGQTFSCTKNVSPLAMAPFHAHTLSETCFLEARLYVNQAMGR